MKVNTLGKTGFILAMVSVLLGGTIILPILGLILSSIGVAKRKQFDTCNKLAIAGIVISIITLIAWIVLDVYGFFVLIIVAIIKGLGNSTACVLSLA